MQTAGKKDNPIAVLLIGAGAVGIAMGAALAAAGMRVIFYAGEETCRAIQEKGIRRIGIFGEINTEAGTVGAVSDLGTLSDGSIGCILICTKTLANDFVAELAYSHRRVIAPGAPLVIMQNGWGNDAPFLKFFEKERIFQARIITGFVRRKLNVSEVTVHTEPMLFGSLYGADPGLLLSVAEAVSASGIEAGLTDCLSEALWAKMLYNTTLNPLGAILGLSYGELGESAHCRAVMDRLMDESFGVLDACGYRTFWRTADEYRRDFYSRMLPETAAHRSSTLRDIECGRRTEIDSLNGAIVEMADAHGIDVPTHRTLCDIIHAMEGGFV